MSDLSREELQRLARIGAQRRLEELRREEAAIRAAFPDIDDARGGVRGRRGRGAGRPGRAAGNNAAAEAPAARSRRGRRKMSAAERKAVSERMKKYWASRRKAKE